MPALLDTCPAGRGGTPSLTRIASAPSTPLGDYTTACPVPNRRWTLGLSTSDGRSQGLRRPRIAMRSQRPAAAMLASEHGVEILSPDAVDMLDFDRGQSAPLDPVADGLPCDLEQVGDLLDREDLGVRRGLLFGHLDQISKDSVVLYSLRLCSYGWTAWRNHSATARW